MPLLLAAGAALPELALLLSLDEELLPLDEELPPLPTVTDEEPELW